ncbi:MAG TPA: hypothetical protein VFI13_10170, partial [Gemmatimonadales bacterium]|nr:hypothetical protein [Gemmatimonadales bacterium]
GEKSRPDTTPVIPGTAVEPPSVPNNTPLPEAGPPVHIAPDLPAARAGDRANRIPPPPAPTLEAPPALTPPKPSHPPATTTLPAAPVAVKAPAKIPMSVEVYSVADLAADEKGGEALAKVVRAVVEPRSWGEDAGVEFLPGGSLLVVRQTEKGHKEVATLLEQLKRHKGVVEESRRRK